MYLVDTSVWLDFLRGRATQAVARFQDILEHDLPYGITAQIFQELLQGAASEEDFQRLQTYLATQRFYHPLDAIESYRKAAFLYFRCRREGVTIRSTADCLIAEVAIEHRLRLVHHDRDFSNMAEVIRELKLA